MSKESSTNPPPPTYLRSVAAGESAKGEPLSAEKREVLEYHLSLYAFNETAKLLGKLSIEFQLLETEVREAISFLINRSDEWIGKIVTGGMPFGNLIDLLSCLFDHVVGDAAAFAKFHKIEKRCRVCADERNSLIHSLWYPDLKGKKGAKTVVLTRRREKMKVAIKDVTEEDVLKIVAEIKSCRNDLNAFWTSTFPEYKEFLDVKS
jgi:hypothetical protein